MPDVQVHILYVDDDPALVRLVEKAAVRRGYLLTHAKDVQDGLSKLDSLKCNVVVLDHHLGSETGLDFLKARTKAEGMPPVIYVTGSTEATVAVNALKAGAFDYVTKSASGDFLELLFNAIEAALARAALERAKIKAENEVREARDRAELMLREVNHRIANSLAMVASLVRMQASIVTDTAAVAALTETQVRIKAISGVHRRLYRSTDIGQVSLNEYIEDLVEDLRSSVQVDGSSSGIELVVEPLIVSTDKTVAIGVAVTELVTNALKYAYDSHAPGQVRVIARALDGGMASVSVEDDGVGWTGSGKPQGTGLGTKIVSAMMTSLNSQLVYQPMAKGTRATFEFAL
ncbi:MAG: response regulator [Rhizobiaceae bacterium]|nr:response regulator [Rhizobiaceae bacterium]